MKQPWFAEGQYVVLILIVLAATSLYGAGLITEASTPVEPQSVFALYGTVLGYLFGSREKKREQERLEKVEERIQQ